MKDGQALFWGVIVVLVIMAVLEYQRREHGHEDEKLANQHEHEIALKKMSLISEGLGKVMAQIFKYAPLVQLPA